MQRVLQMIHQLSKACKCVMPLLLALKIDFGKVTAKFFKYSETPSPYRPQASIPSAPLHAACIKIFVATSCLSWVPD
jgi:hypothetical protein